MTDKTTILEGVLEGLMKRYKERVPDVERILDAMAREKLIRSIDDIENDHIAFRSLGVPHLGIQSLEKIFLHLGYTKERPLFFCREESECLVVCAAGPPVSRGSFSVSCAYRISRTIPGKSYITIQDV